MTSSIIAKTRGILVAGFVFMFLIGLPGYLFLTGISGVAPRYIFLTSLVFLFFCDVSYKSIHSILPFVTWHVALVLIGTGSFIIHSHSVWADAGVLALWGRVFVALWAVIIGASLPTDRLMKVVAMATTANALICLLDIVFPFILYKPTELMLYGRAAGLFLQPNGAASAMALGFLVSHSEIDKRWFYPFLAVTVLGLVATLSRGALLCFFSVLLFAKFPKIVLSTRFRMIVGFIAILVSASLYSLDWEEVRAAANLWFDVLGGRAVGGLDDMAAADRVIAARKAWNVLSDFPSFGLGVGYTRHWDLEDSPHNMYLAFSAEFGVIGLVLLLSYFVAGYCSVPTRFKRSARLVFGFLFLFFIFTHNHFDDYVALIVVGVLVGASLRRGRSSIACMASS